MKKRARYPKLAKALLVSLFLFACGQVTESPGLAGPCTETGNPTGIKGKVLGLNGKPVSGAAVRLLHRSGPDTLGLAARISETQSCADGSFGFAKIALATYALEALDSTSGTLAWHPKATVSDTNSALNISLNLSVPAQLSGTVTRGLNPLPIGIIRNEKIVIRILDTDKSFLTDTSGQYHFPKLGAGTYRLAFTALDGHYLTRFVDSVILVPGQTKELPRIDLEWSPFVAPPTPLIPTLDSLGPQEVRVHWNPVYVSNLLRYEVQRKDSLDEALTDTIALMDTVFFDSLKKFVPGHKILYRVRAINFTGTPSEWSSTRQISSPQKPDTAPNVSDGKFTIVAHVTLDGSDAIASSVSLFKIPSQADAPDSLPRPVQTISQSRVDLKGQVIFDTLPSGRYGIEAKDALTGNAAYAILTTVTDTLNAELYLKPTGTIQGTVSRQGLWVAEPGKGNRYVQVSLQGTPYQFYSGNATPSGAYTLTNIPPGQYDLAIYAPPEGYFLVDTVKSIVVQSGATTEIPLVKCLYSPDAPPPKLIGLRITSSAHSKLGLQWFGAPTYPFLKGYEVLRMDESRKILASSGPIKEMTWIDDLTGIPSGTQLYYLVRVVNTQGQTGLPGGDSTGNPVVYTVL